MKIFTVMCSAFVLGIGLAACGDGGGGTPDPGPVQDQGPQDPGPT